MADAHLNFRWDAAMVWRNGRIPVVFKPAGKDIMVRLPTGHSDQREWFSAHRDWLLGNGRRIRWVEKPKGWELPPSRFDGIIALILLRYGSVYVIQEFRPLEKCAPACWNAVRFDCECSCLGANHGSGRELAFVVSHTLALQWGGRQLACRLITIRRGLEISKTVVEL